MKRLVAPFTLLLALFGGFTAAAEEFSPELQEAMRQECLLNLSHPDGKSLSYEKRLKAYSIGCDCMIKSYVEYAPVQPLQERFEAGQRMMGTGDVEKSIPREVQLKCMHVINDAVVAELDTKE